MIFYISSIFSEQGQCVLKPKSCGSGIMVSDFIDEHNRYLKLTDEFIQGVDKVDGIQKETHAFLEYGKEHEGYWTAKNIYLRNCCQNCKYAEDALDASKMNLKPGGKQPKMHDTIWNGKVQRMVYSKGV